MAKNETKKAGKKESRSESRGSSFDLHPDIKKSVWVVAFMGVTVLLILAAAEQAGPWGASFYSAFKTLFGWGYFFLPIVSFLFALSFFTPERERFFGITAIAGGIFILSGLGFIDVVSPGSGGLTGNLIGALKSPFGVPASLVVLFTLLAASFIVTINRPLEASMFRKLFPKKAERGREDIEEEELEVKLPVAPIVAAPVKTDSKKKEEMPEIKVAGKKDEDMLEPTDQKPIKDYVAPPLSLLATSVEKPTIGDLRANANIIKRTLESFGITTEMGEINVGPTVTRYTLKPADGVKLSRITTLSQDLSLALAAHPIRIEAPIPGKSLVGIEVPNKSAAIVRMGSLFLYPEFEKSGPLSFALGRNVNGDPVFADIEKMPHLLIAGATGSGKSISIHTLILSLLYKNSPAMLKLIMIDPKRVELSIYNGLPHLIAPVVTENKKAIGALRWLIQEMDRRYNILLEAGARDIKSFNKKGGEPLPYIVAVIDELADLMVSYGREVEGAIIRLAQMARATGIHLIVSTQRPSVEVITGLIKANITSRVALQVASQVDSRTILDTAGAEKLLGHGDLLFVSAELSKPRRIQGGFVTEEEIKRVASFITKNNHVEEEEEIELDSQEAKDNSTPTFEDLAGDDDDDAMYVQAVEVVRSAKKASASLLQRRLKVGYARAARLLDMMEERGIIGPGDGAKPRDVYDEEGGV